MQISTALFLQAHNASSDKKVSKDAVAKELNQTLDTPNTPSQPGTIKDVIANLMGTLVLEAKSKGAVLEFLQHSPLFKNLGNFQNDLKHLIALLKDDKAYEKPLLLLQNFQKDITQVDDKTLKSQLKHSGVFFESTLANILSKKSIEYVIKPLNTELKEYLSLTKKSPLLTKEITPLLEKLADVKSLSPQEMQTTLKALLPLVRQSTKEHLSFESPALLKNSYTTSLKLEQRVNELPLIASKSSNASDTTAFASFFHDVRELLQTLQADIEAYASPEVASTLLPQVETLMNESLRLPSPMPSLEIDISLEEKLSMLANRIKQSIALADPQGVKLAHYTEKSAQLEQKISTLLVPERYIAPDILQKLSIDPSNVDILGDMKSILTSLGDKLSTASGSMATQASESTQKLLAQIEYHQLVSYVGSATHVYIPFTWNGLKEGSLMMKQSKEDTFHCQIDLDLEAYGKINMMLFLQNDNYLDMTIATQKQELSMKVSEYLSDLKKALNDVGIITQGVKLIEYKEANVKQKEYFADDNLNFGINITI